MKYRNLIRFMTPDSIPAGGEQNTVKPDTDTQAAAPEVKQQIDSMTESEAKAALVALTAQMQANTEATNKLREELEQTKANNFAQALAGGTAGAAITMESLLHDMFIAKG